MFDSKNQSMKKGFSLVLKVEGKCNCNFKKILQNLNLNYIQTYFFLKNMLQAVTSVITKQYIKQLTCWQRKLRDKIFFFFLGKKHNQWFCNTTNSSLFCKYETNILGLYFFQLRFFFKTCHFQMIICLTMRKVFVWSLILQGIQKCFKDSLKPKQ